MEIIFNDVSYKYNNLSNSKVGLSNVSINFKENTINGIVGKSGSGKTTMIELINALIIPDKGNIKIGSRVISKTRKIKNINNLRYKIGLVFENVQDQFFCDTVYKEIKFGMKNFKKLVNDVDKHIKDSLLMVGLDESYLNKNPYNLSSGEQKK